MYDLARRGVQNPKAIPSYIKRTIGRKTGFLYKKEIEQSFNNNTWQLLVPRFLDYFHHDRARGCHEPTTTRIIIEEIEQNTVFWDVGAHIGHFPVAALHLTDIKPENIHIFEPHSEFSRLINENLNQIQNARRVSINTYGLGASDSDTTVVADDYMYNNGCPDLIKIDAGPAEGYPNEDDILEGMADILYECRPTIIFEIHFHVPDYEAHLEDIRDLFSENVYNFRICFDHHKNGDTWQTLSSVSEFPEEGSGDYLVVAHPKED